MVCLVLLASSLPPATSFYAYISVSVREKSVSRRGELKLITLKSLTERLIASSTSVRESTETQIPLKRNLVSEVRTSMRETSTHQADIGHYKPKPRVPYAWLSSKHDPAPVRYLTLNILACPAPNILIVTVGNETTGWMSARGMKLEDDLTSNSSGIHN